MWILNGFEENEYFRSVSSLVWMETSLRHHRDHYRTIYNLLTLGIRSDSLSSIEQTRNLGFLYSEAFIAIQGQR